MPTGFDEAFKRVKELVADFRDNENFYLSPAYLEQEARGGLDRQTDAVVDDLYALMLNEIKIAEGAGI